MSQVRYVSTISGNNNDIVTIGGRRVNVDLELGEIRDVGHSTYIRSTYASRYNFAVKQYNSYETESNKMKQNMRGSGFFLYGIIIFIFLVASIVCITQISRNKFISIPPIVISVFYICLTCFNWHIHRTNGSLIHDQMIEVKRTHICNSINQHFVIPVHARIQNQEFVAASDGSTTAILGRLQQRYQNLTEIRVMLYGSVYKSRYAGFPGETVFHFIVFLVLLVFAINALVNQATG